MFSDFNSISSDSILDVSFDEAYREERFEALDYEDDIEFMIDEVEIEFDDEAMRDARAAISAYEQREAFEADELATSEYIVQIAINDARSA